MEKFGLMHIYCGAGKGKTTAAVGLALRCLGQGGRVVMTQFLKDGCSGECRMLAGIEGATLLAVNPCGKFSFQMTAREREQTAQAVVRTFENTLAFVERTSPDLLILDEICAAVQAGFLEQARLLDFLDHRPAGLEVVLTGREPSEALRERADYLSEIQAGRHPYEAGIAARRGIEF